MTDQRFDSVSTAPPGEIRRSEPVADVADRGEDLSGLWARLRATRDLQARDALVTAYFPLVKHVARRVATSIAYQVEIGDLEGYGSVGLINAVDRYDMSLGAQFATFAAHRIRGAIYDGIRATDWAPRSVRRREREIRANFAQFCATHGREPTEDEEGRALGTGVAALRAAKHQIRDAQVTSLEVRPRPDRLGVVLELADTAAEPLEQCLAHETSDTLRAGLSTLDERERTVTMLSFEEGLTLAEIGLRLGVTESRVSQIRTGAISRLRAYARAQGLAPA